jgi:hypothetical protein
MTNFKLTEEAATNQQDHEVLDSGGVWRVPIYVDENGEVTTKDKSVTSTLVPKPEGECMWDSEAKEWKPPVFVQQEIVPNDLFQIYKLKEDSREEAHAPTIIHDDQPVKVINR